VRVGVVLGSGFALASLATITGGIFLALSARHELVPPEYPYASPEERRAMAEAFLRRCDVEAGLLDLPLLAARARIGSRVPVPVLHPRRPVGRRLGRARRPPVPDLCRRDAGASATTRRACGTSRGGRWACSEGDSDRWRKDTAAEEASPAAFVVVPDIQRGAVTAAAVARSGADLPALAGREGALECRRHGAGFAPQVERTACNDAGQTSHRPASAGVWRIP
jgi:hypothetical protein